MIQEVLYYSCAPLAKALEFDEITPGTNLSKSLLAWDQRDKRSWNKVNGSSDYRIALKVKS